MAFKDILFSNKYADDMTISLPDGTTATLGEMRSLSAAERQAIMNRQSALEAAEQGISQRVNTLRNAGLLDDNLNPVTTRQTTSQIKEAITSVTGLDESDPLFGPLVKEMKSELAKIKSDYDGQLTAMKNQYGQLAGATQQAVKGYLDDFYKSTYSTEVAKLPEEIRSEVKLSEVMDFATKRRLLDENGRLDISSAIDRMTWDARKNHEMSAVKKNADQLKADREALASMQRPGLRNPHHTQPSKEGFSPIDDKGHTKSLDEAIAAAGMDDEIWASAMKFTGQVQ